MSKQRGLPNLSGEVLRAIRGDLTSSAFSRKLGYKFDQVSRWERGERRFLWPDFVAACQARRLPLREQLSAYLGNGNDLLDTAKFIKALLSGKSIELAAKSAKLSRSKLSRWLGGKATPTFLDVYALLSLSINAISFFEPLVDQSKIASLALDYAEFRRQRELAYSLPHLDALMEALVVRRYLELKAHSPAVLGAIAGLRADVVSTSLTALEAAGMVKKVGGKFRAVELNIDYTADRSRITKNILHWLSEISRAIERTEGRPMHGSLVAFSVLSLSQENHEKVNTLFRHFLRQVYALGSEDQGPKEKVLVLANALMDASQLGD